MKMIATVTLDDGDQKRFEFDVDTDRDNRFTFRDGKRVFMTIEMRVEP